MNKVVISVPFRTQAGVVQVKRDQIIAAMKKFDLELRSSDKDSGTRYAVKNEGKRYPPKRILELATKIPRNRFFGGKPSNDVLDGLGFPIIVSDGKRSGKTSEQTAAEKTRLDGPVPDIGQLVKDLFNSRWARLDDDSVKQLPDSQYPGVYVLAYTDRKLLGLQVRENAIFYVGVSHMQGVRKRLRQFRDGLEDGDHHSGAGRFFKEVAKQTPYSELAQRKLFFVTSISVPCESRKAVRSPMDLRKLGVVAQLEWYVIARVKEKTTHEPWLNLK